MPKTRVFIWGSCVSRDTFEFLPQDEFELIRYIARQSAISAYSKPVTLAAAPTLESPFQQRMASGDFGSNLGSALRTAGNSVDLMLIDLADERLGVYILPDGSVVTRSVEFINANGESQLPAGTRYAAFGTPEHFEFWKTAIERIGELVRTYMPRAAIAVINIPWALRSDSGSDPGSSYGLTPAAANQIFPPYVSAASSALRARVISVDPATVRAASDHPWGPAPFHYAQDVYETACATLLAAAGGAVPSDSVEKRTAPLTTHVSTDLDRPGGARSSEPRHSVCLVAVLKNEAPYILEWIAWHRLQGIKHFILADNESDDGLSEILEALERQGIITRFIVASKPSQSPQVEAYNLAAQHYRSTSDWFLFIDADEFLAPTKSGLTAEDYVRSIPDSAGSVHLNWAVYGSSERDKPGLGAVTRRFANRAHQSTGVNRHYKTLVRTEALADRITNIHDIDIQPGWDRLNSQLSPEVPGPARGLSKDAIWANMRINHYVIKSWTEFWEKKASRGRASGQDGLLNESFFSNHDLNDCYDPISVDLHDALMSEMDALREMLSELPDSLRYIDASIAKLIRHPRAKPSGRGNIERAWVTESGDLVVRGWAAGSNGEPAARPGVRGNGSELLVKSVKRMDRKDVLRMHSEVELKCGVELVVDGSSITHSPRKMVLQLTSLEGGVLHGKPREFTLGAE